MRDKSALFFLVIGFLLAFRSQAQDPALDRYLLKNLSLNHSFIGVSVYDATEGKMLLSHDSFKYFTPASNTKLYTFFAGLRYLGDSTTGIQYQIREDTLFIRGTGDPTFLHPKFENQKALAFLKSSPYPVALIETKNENEIYGPGWAWDDYSSGYQPERSAFPVYGNVVRFSLRDGRLRADPVFFEKPGKLLADRSLNGYGFKVKRNRDENLFYYNITGQKTSKTQEVPFILSPSLFLTLLETALNKKVAISRTALPDQDWKDQKNTGVADLFKEMLYESDNFLAEQTMAMVSMKLFGEIDTEKAIQHLLDNDLKILPDKPEWVDGSGLSRYNLFSPSDMVTALTLLYSSYPIDLLKMTLPTAGKGTLNQFYEGLEGRLFAKTGSLNNNYAISGYLLTGKKHVLIFSVMVNHTAKPLNVSRKSIGDFLRSLSDRY